MSDERVRRGVEWFDANFNGIPDSEALVRGILEVARPSVKALEWEYIHEEGVETYQAPCSFGLYRVFDDEDSAGGAIFVEFAINESHFCMTDAVSIDRVSDFVTAKAAAQSDYERRILSALE